MRFIKIVTVLSLSVWAQSWQSIAGGTDLPVNVLYEWQGFLYVGGRFSSVGSPPLTANGIARYSPSTGWQNVGPGQGVSAGGQVYAMTVYQGKLIVGGNFTSIGGVSARHIAAYDPVSNTWTEVGGGVSDEVYALGVYDGELLVGGRFMFVGANNAQAIGIFARWNGTQWLAPDPSQGNTLLSGGVPRAFVEFQGKLYLAGSFTTAYYNQTDYAYLCIWNKALQRLETAYPSGQGPDNNIWDAVVWNNALYIGGDFTGFGSATGRLVRFTGTAASTVSGAPAAGSVRKLLPMGSNLYVAGSFTTAGSQTVNRIARLSSSGTWYALGSGLGPTIVSTITWYNNLLCAGGNFTTDGIGQGVLNNLASFGTLTALPPEIGSAPLQIIRQADSYVLSVEAGQPVLHIRLLDVKGCCVLQTDLYPGDPYALQLPAPGLYLLEIQSTRGRWTYRLY